MSIDFTNPKPLYHQIADNIKSKIDEGQLKIGDQLASQKELADEYKVSMITVKKAIADLINEGVLFSRIGKGTFVAKKPIPIRLSKSPTIGIVLRDINNPFFSLIAQSFENHAYKEGYNILLSNSSNQMDKEEKQIQNFLELGANGLIIASMSHVYQKTATIEKLHREGFPYVMVSYSEDKNDYFSGYEIGEAFIKLKDRCMLQAQSEYVSLQIAVYGSLPNGDFAEKIGDNPCLTRRAGFDVGNKVGLAQTGYGPGIELDTPVLMNGLEWVISLRYPGNSTDRCPGQKTNLSI